MKLLIDNPGRLDLINKHWQWIGFQQPIGFLGSFFFIHVNLNLRCEFEFLYVTILLSIKYNDKYVLYIKVVFSIIRSSTKRSDTENTVDYILKSS